VGGRTGGHRDTPLGAPTALLAGATGRDDREDGRGQDAPRRGDGPHALVTAVGGLRGLVRLGCLGGRAVLLPLTVRCRALHGRLLRRGVRPGGRLPTALPVLVRALTGGLGSLALVSLVGALAGRLRLLCAGPLLGLVRGGGLLVRRLRLLRS